MVGTLFSRMQIGHYSHIVQFMSFIYVYRFILIYILFLFCFYYYVFFLFPLDTLYISSVYVVNNYSCNSKYPNIDLLFQFWLLTQYCLHCHVTYTHVKCTFSIQSHRKHTAQTHTSRTDATGRRCTWHVEDNL